MADKKKEKTLSERFTEYQAQKPKPQPPTQRQQPTIITRQQGRQQQQQINTNRRGVCLSFFLFSFLSFLNNPFLQQQQGRQQQQGLLARPPYPPVSGGLDSHLLFLFFFRSPFLFFSYFRLTQEFPNLPNLLSPAEVCVPSHFLNSPPSQTHPSSPSQTYPSSPGPTVQAAVSRGPNVPPPHASQIRVLGVSGPGMGSILASPRGPLAHHHQLLVQQGKVVPLIAHIPIGPEAARKGKGGAVVKEVKKDKKQLDEELDSYFMKVCFFGEKYVFRFWFFDFQNINLPSSPL